MLVLTRRADTEAESATDGAPPIAERGQHKMPTWGGQIRGRAAAAKELEECGRAHAIEFTVHRADQHAAVAIQNEHGRLGNPAFFLAIDDAPGLDHFAPRVAQDRERQIVLPADGFGPPGFVHGESGKIKARIVEGPGVVAILRQLAEAHRSPMTAVENQDARALGHELRERARLARRIGQSEVGSNFTALWDVSAAHAYLTRISFLTSKTAKIVH